jgi:large subunit ribosomal protein L10
VDVPTEKKRQIIAELAADFRRSTMLISTDFSGLPVNELTDLRRRLRERSVSYRVVKNRLASLAAKAAGLEEIGDIMEASTGIVFGYEDPIEAAKVVDEFVKATRSRLVIRNGFMDGKVISAGQLAALAVLPPRPELLANLLGRLQAPITGMVTVLSGPVRGLATVLQRRADQMAAG